MSELVLPNSNPLREIRLSLKYSLDRLAGIAGVSRQLIIRAEQAVYADPPPRLLETLLELNPDSEIDEEVIRVRYREFQRHTRKSNYGALSVGFKFSEGKGLHPFIDWRVRSGVRARIGPAKLFCVHPALIHKFELQPWLCQTPPGDLILALRESGYSSETLDDLGKAFYIYKMHRRSNGLSG